MIFCEIKIPCWDSMTDLERSELIATLQNVTYAVLVIHDGMLGYWRKKTTSEKYANIG